MKTILLIALPLAVMRSCGLTAADLAPPPDTLVVPCQEPQRLPVRTLTQGEAEVFWGRDRAAVRDCGERHGLLVAWARGQVGACEGVRAAVGSCHRDIDRKLRDKIPMKFAIERLPDTR